MPDIALRIASNDDAHLPTFDFTKLSAINSCPRWGVLRYHLHKTMGNSEGFRNMALEAGTTAHECFAAIRLWQVGEQGHSELMHLHGTRIFGEERWACIVSAMASEDGMRNAALECLSTSGFTDDPSDRRRTYSNLETSLLYYCQRWDHARYPVWVSGDKVGIEIAFDIVVDERFRYTGRVDGIHVDRGGELLIQENKTASRLGTAWRMAFNTSHQVTGYCAAASLFTGMPVGRAIVLGLTLPLPRTLSDGLAMEMVTRREHAFRQWGEWMFHSVQMCLRYEDDPLAAPMYTGSCNRYFTPCSFIPLCAGDAEEQELTLSEMSQQEWSPLHA